MLGWEIHSGICVPKIIIIERGLTELLRKYKGCIFFASHGINLLVNLFIKISPPD